MINVLGLEIVIENPKGSYKSFDIENDPVWHSYPLKGVTYPVDYGYINGYWGEDGSKLDVFVGTGDKYGWIKVSRLDVPKETKFFLQLTDDELQAVLDTFIPVLLEHQEVRPDNLISELANFQEKP